MLVGNARDFENELSLRPVILSRFKGHWTRLHISEVTHPSLEVEPMV